MRGKQGGRRGQGRRERILPRICFSKFEPNNLWFIIVGVSQSKNPKSFSMQFFLSKHIHSLL